MLTIKKMGAVALVLGISFAACTNDPDPEPYTRVAGYSLIRGVLDSVQTGQVDIYENRDSTTSLYLSVKKTTKDTVSKVYVIKGHVATPTTDTIFKGTLTGNGGRVEIPVWKNSTTIRYDSAVKIEAFAKVQYSATKDSIVAIGNILKFK